MFIKKIAQRWGLCLHAQAPPMPSAIGGFALIIEYKISDDIALLTEIGWSMFFA